MWDHAGECKSDLVSIQQQQLAEKDRVIQQQDNKIDLLKEALQEVIDFIPNDTDYPKKPTRDECLDEIKYFAKAALEAAEKGR